eukprot:144852_1
MDLDEQQIKRYIQSIAEIRRVLVPYPPKIEIYTIDANRIKIKIWDQKIPNSSSSLIGGSKKEKTEFIAKIAEQPIKMDSSISMMPDGDEDDSNNNNDDGKEEEVITNQIEAEQEQNNDDNDE